MRLVDELGRVLVATAEAAAVHPDDRGPGRVGVADGRVHVELERDRVVRDLVDGRPVRDVGAHLHPREDVVEVAHAGRSGRRGQRTGRDDECRQRDGNDDGQTTHPKPPIPEWGSYRAIAAEGPRPQIAPVDIGFSACIERTFVYNWDMSAARTTDELEALDPSLLCDSEIRDTFIELRRENDRREAVAARMLVALHRRGVPTGEGASSTPMWVQFQTGQRLRDARVSLADREGVRVVAARGEGVGAG